MTDAETGGRRTQPKRRESERRVTRNAGISLMLERSRRSNVQFPAEMPITVAVIGICPTTRNSVARQPSREGRRRPHRRRTGECTWRKPGSAGARLCGGTASSRPHWKRQASRSTGRTPSEPRCPTPACSPMAGFARWLASRRESRDRSRHRSLDVWAGKEASRPAR